MQKLVASFQSLLLAGTMLVSTQCSQDAETKIEDDGKKPDDNRFTPVTLTAEGALDEPMMFQVSSDGSVYIVERKGALKRFDPPSKSIRHITTIPVFTGNEQGLIGITLDPNFDQNRWIYLQYAPLEKSIFRLVRYELRDDKLVEGTEKVMLEIPVDREHTSHTGGGMAWDKNGNLYLTVGNNTGNRLTAQTDERPGYAHLDDQRGASNTNDLRGKILRIHPERDGTYTIPHGNLFPPGTEKTRPEIYTMGHRNVWRVSIDSKTGWIYWGEIGPDQDVDSETGPRGYDEQNQAKGPGFYGWPYFIADNQVIPKYDFVNNRVGEKLDPARPKNNSPNNTGLVDLPPAQPAFIYYPYAASEKFPLVGSSSRCAIGGPVFRRGDFSKPSRPFPAWYEGKWLMADYSRFWIMAVTMDEHGNYQSMERFAPHYSPVQPLDIKFGPDGDLYVLEYGSNTVRSSVESRLVRIEYNAGNRKPVVKASASRKGGALPFTTKLRSDGTVDHDKDSLSYAWRLKAPDGTVQQFSEANPVVTLANAGNYEATLTVTDSKGESNSATIALTAGNEPPRVDLIYRGNTSFFFPETKFDYDVKVTDPEDSLDARGISAAQVAFSIDYVSEGFDFAPIKLRHAALDEASRFTVAKALIINSDCRNCHTVDVKAVGPSFRQIAERYATARNAGDTLAKRIIRGSTGLWGTDNNMPAHPSISPNDARVIAAYILGTTNPTVRPLPVKGSFTPTVPRDDKGKGTYILRASYTDRGSNAIAPITSDTTIFLRSPKLNPLQADVIAGGALRDQLDEYIFLTTKPGSHILYRNVDLSGVIEILIRANWHLYDIYPGGKIEIRKGGPEGALIGETDIEREQFNTRYRGLFDGLRNPTADQERRSRRFPPLAPNIFFARGSDKTSHTIPSIASLQPVTGRIDLCFVFKNDTLKSEDSMFPLAEIVLLNKSASKK